MIDIEPEYIPETNELKLLRKYVQKNLPKLKPSLINSACEVLKITLYKRYGKSYSMETFICDANSNFTESDIFSKNMISSFPKLWALNTKKNIFYVIKKILNQTSVSDDFVNRLSFKNPSKIYKYNPTVILAKKHSKLPDDNPVKLRLISWIEIIKNKTKNKSVSSIKAIISFFVNKCLPQFNLRLEYWDCKDIIINQDIVSFISTSYRYFIWLKLFCEHILNIEFNYTFSKEETFDHSNYYSGDKHTISNKELQLIFLEAKKSNILDQLIFMLLITTGMRIGGFINIKLQHVADTSSKELKIFNSGRTLEKGNKWFEFVITDSVKLLLYKWITKERKGNSEFLFSSSTTPYGHISSNTIRSRFKKLCKKANLKGKHLHIHSLRHTYAHILLKCGNDISTISKLLNHSNTSITEQFYLKETISQVVGRATIPWLDKSNKPEEKLPDFLSIEKDIQKKEKKKKKINRKMKRLESINHILTEKISS